MNEKKLRRKLRKKAVKLARFAHENGIEHIDLFAIDHPEDGMTFYSAVLFGDNDPDVDVSGFVGGEVDAQRGYRPAELRRARA